MNVLTIIVDRTEKGLALRNWSQMSSDGADLNAIEILQSLQMTSGAILQLLSIAQQPRGGEK